MFLKNIKDNRCIFDRSHKQNLYDLLIWKVEAKDSNEMIANELKISDSDLKKLNNGKETEMKKYFILELSLSQGLKKEKEMIREYWKCFLCMMNLVGKYNDIIIKHYNLLSSHY